MCSSRVLGALLSALLIGTPSYLIGQQKNKEAGPPIGDDKAVTPIKNVQTTDELPYSQLKADVVESPELGAPEMKRYQAVASAGEGWPQPATVAEVPVNPHADVKRAVGEQGVEFEPFNPDNRDVKLAVVWKQDRAQISNQEAPGLYAELDKLWVGKPSNLTVNGKGDVLYNGKAIWLVFGWREGNTTQFYDEGILERNNEIFARFAAGIVVEAKPEALDKSGGHPVYFGVFLDGQKVDDPAQEKALQEKIYWLLAGKAVENMETDTWGNLYFKEEGSARKKVELRYFNLRNLRLYLIPEAEQVALGTRFRRQVRYALTIEVNKAQERLVQLQAANQKIARIQQILDLKTSTSREERQAQLSEAEKLVDQATSAWTSHGEGFPQFAAQTRKLSEYKTEVDYQLGRLSYPFALELPTSCDNYVLYQLNADTVNLYLRAEKVIPGTLPSDPEQPLKIKPLGTKTEPEEQDTLTVDTVENGPQPLKAPQEASVPEEEEIDEVASTRVRELKSKDVMLAQFKGERIPFHCFDGAIAVYADWAPIITSKLRYSTKASDLTAEQLDTFTGRGLFVVKNTDLVIAQSFKDQGKFEAFAVGETSSSRKVAHLSLENVKDSFYEFSSDGTTLRWRLETDASWKDYVFEKMTDGGIRTFFVEENGSEVELGRIEVSALSTLNVVEGSLAFSTDRFKPAEPLTLALDGTGSTIKKDELEALQGSNALYLIRGSTLHFARRAQAGQKIKDVKVGDLGERTVFVARYDGEAGYSHILSPKADLFQSHFNFGKTCSSYKAVIEDEKEIQLFWTGRESVPLVGIQGLGSVTCTGDGIAFFAKKLSYDPKVLTEKLTGDSNVLLSSIEKGLDQDVLVVIAGDEVRTLMIPYFGQRFKALKTSVDAENKPVFAISFEGEVAFEAQISLAGRWVYPKQFGSPYHGYAILQFPDEERSFVALNGEIIATTERIVSAKSAELSLALISDGIYPVKGLEDRFRTTLDTQPEGGQALYVFNKNTLVAAKESRSPRDDEKFQSVGVVNISGLGVNFRVWTTNNVDYTELIGLDGKSYHPFKYAKFDEENISLSEAGWVDLLQEKKEPMAEEGVDEPPAPVPVPEEE